MKAIELGFKVKDAVTGFTGIVTEKCFYLNGCIQCRVTPPIDKKDPSKIPDSHWFDIEQLIYVDDGVKKTKELAKKPTGGSTRNAPNYDNGKR